MKYTLGFDIGSSSVKVSLVKAETGECVATAFHPKKEMEIVAQHPGWAEQDPKMWWKYTKEALAEVLHSAQIDASQIKAIGISYQCMVWFVLTPTRRLFVLQLSGAIVVLPKLANRRLNILVQNDVFHICLILREILLLQN
jgi:ribulose kinase